MQLPDFPDVTQLAVPFFIGSMLLELGIGRITGRARYETRDTLTSLLMGGGNLVLGILLGFLSYDLLLWLYEHAAPVQIAFSVPAMVACFALDDLRYYIYHRAAHECRWFWASHVNHHSSQHYNLSTALRQTWTYELSLSFLFRVPLALMGFHPAMLAFAGGINLVYQFWIHTELIHRMPRWFEAVFNTPSHHRVHHAVNPRYLDANYAGTFIVWDRLLGTFVAERDDDPPRYGLTKNLGTFNPLRVAMHEYADLAKDVLKPGLTLSQRLRYAFGRPGWSHDGSRQTALDMKAAYAARHPEEAGRDGLPVAPHP